MVGGRCRLCMPVDGVGDGVKRATRNICVYSLYIPLGSITFTRLPGLGVRQPDYDSRYASSRTMSTSRYCATSATLPTLWPVPVHLPPMFGSSRVLFCGLLALGPDGLALLQDGGAVVEHVALVHQLDELLHVERARAVDILRAEEAHLGLG